ncbi:Uma2 family endonuclease [Larkinella sp. GY13]|uniref:Uma2 family endonuclease n=1 Tax=Larkinella sp. GY13 TaxID=3453720 RepID=UPI003EEC4F94
MIPAPPAARVSEEEYFALLKGSTEKLEYHDGEIVAMAGAQLPHNLIASNLIRLLGNCLLESNCLVLNSDQLVHLVDCYKYVFPDLAIVCQKPILTERYGLDVLENPEIIVEILSDSTELFDRTEKFDCYKQITSVKEYVLVASKKKKVEVFRRTESNEWLLHDYLPQDEVVKISACTLLMDDIYRKVGFEQQQVEQK